MRSSLLIDHKFTGQSDNANVYVFQSARSPCCLVPSRTPLPYNFLPYPALLPSGSRGSIRFSMDESLTDRWHIDPSQKARCHDVLSPFLGMKVGSGQDNTSEQIIYPEDLY